jgi:MFS family permease
VVLLTGVLVGPTALLLFALAGGWVRFPLLFLAGAATESMHPACMALVQETFPESRGLANALYLSTVFVMSSVAAVAVGALGDGLGLRWAFVISALVVFLSLPLILWLPRETRAAR